MHYHPSFSAPAYLALLSALPVLWWYSYRRLFGLGLLRRWVALLLRTFVILLLVLAAADLQIVETSDQLTVIYLLDQSTSIPAADRRAIVQYAKAAVERHRKEKDRAAVIVFGREAAIEVPPFDDKLPDGLVVESPIDPEYTNLAAAMKLAQATFPEGAARRIVLVTDGNQNLGNAVEQAQSLAAAGIGIDIVPVRYHTRAEVAVERVILPGNVRRDQNFDIRIVVSNNCDPRPGDKGEVPGRLVVSEIVDDRPTVITDPKDDHVVLPPGKSVFTVRRKIDSSNFYTYEARFIPDRPEDDAMPQNNRATAFTHVEGKGQVLVIENHERRGTHEVLVKRLRQQGLEVTVRGTDQLFSGLAELQQYDTVVLANVARAINEEVSFSDEQIKMLVVNTQQMGAGLVMIGGPDSFGAGGWTGTELEAAMPVDFQIRNAEVAPRGALVLLMHASEIPAGNHIQKLIAKEAIKALSAQDYCGVMQWTGAEQWIYGTGPVEVGQYRPKLLAAVDRMTPGDMPTFEPAMLLAEQGFAGLMAGPNPPAIKHMVVLSDGDPGAPSPATMARLRQMGVTVSTVSVDAHGTAESQNMADIASQGQGKYYTVGSNSAAKALPRIFQKEARRVSRPLIYEPGVAFDLKRKSLHEMTAGIDRLPPITGYVLTSKKENPLVETALLATKPGGEDNTTILAGWTYGLGKAAAFTTDADGRWTEGWADSPVYDKLFGQIVRWSMRPSGTTGKFTAAFEPHDGQMRVVITALDKNDDFLNFLAMAGTAVGPDLARPLDLQIEQTGPGRYVGSFPAHEAGSYFVTVNPGRGMTPLRLGVSVPYSDEYRDRGPNDALLAQLVSLEPKDGAPGQVIENLGKTETMEPLLATNTFRHDLAKASASQETWHWLLVLASSLFLADVFVRRVHVHFDWVPPLTRLVVNFVLRRQPAPVQPQFIERLKSRKAEVTDRLEQLRAATRFEAPPSAPVDLKSLEELAPPPPEAKRPGPAAAPEKKEEESYTERLLKAKKKVWDEREKP